MDLLRLEQQRHALESNLQQLRLSLRHWQAMEAEYEGLKEELQLLDPSDTALAALSRIADSHHGDLLNAQEVRDLAGLDTSSPRSPEQIMALIDRRQEYVLRNIDTVQRQFFDAEAKQEELAFAAANYGSVADAASGLPLTEIHEELDDDDNVISSRLTCPEEATAQVVESLRKAGLSESDLSEPTDDTSATQTHPKSAMATASPPSTPTATRTDDLKPALVNPSPPLSVTGTTPERHTHSSPELSRHVSDDSYHAPERPRVRKKSVSFTADTKSPPQPTRQDSDDGKKTVSFATKVAVMPAAPPPDTRSVSFSPKIEEIPTEAVHTDSPAPASASDLKQVPIETNPSRQRELRQSFKPGDRVVQLNDNDEIESVQIVMPENESPEDAATRREMLDYHLNEVGNVVAQLNLDNGWGEMGDDDDDHDDDDTSSFHTTSEYFTDDDTPYTTGVSESDDEEDHFGRSKHSQISSEYRNEMLELEKRLIGNLGPSPKDEEIADVDPELDPQDVRKLVVREKRTSVSSASSDGSDKKPPTKKRVSFAEELDVAPAVPPPPKMREHQKGENVAPLTDAVTERFTTTLTDAALEAPSKPSRFKQDRIASVASSNAASNDAVTPANSASSHVAYGADPGLDHSQPSDPPSRILATNLFERTPLPGRTALAPSVDEADPVFERRQLATEYYKRRNGIIQQQGGFKASTEDEDEDEMYGELMEEKDGKMKKVSRFRAARIKGGLNE